MVLRLLLDSRRPQKVAFWLVRLEPGLPLAMAGGGEDSEMIGGPHHCLLSTLPQFTLEKQEETYASSQL
jgi:hypothetical protein